MGRRRLKVSVLQALVGRCPKVSHAQPSAMQSLRALLLAIAMMLLLSFHDVVAEDEGEGDEPYGEEEEGEGDERENDEVEEVDYVGEASAIIEEGDKDKDGLLNQEELIAIFMDGVPEEEQEKDELEEYAKQFKAADANKDGKLDQAEMVSMLETMDKGEEL